MTPWQLGGLEPTKRDLDNRAIQLRVVFSMATSSSDFTSGQTDFVFSKNRLILAISRAGGPPNSPAPTSSWTRGR